MFVNTRYLSPVVMDGIPNLPENSYEYHEYWDEQKRRCLEGYSVGDITITGRHYHYLNFSKLRGSTKERPQKHLMPPKFIDMDFDWYNQLDRAIREGKGLATLKRRQGGFSYKVADTARYDFEFIPDSVTVVTSGEEHYSVNTQNFIIAGLNQSAGTPFYKKRTPDSFDMMRAAFEETIDGQRVMSGYFSELHRRTASSPQALVGLSPSKVIFEEWGKFPGVKEVFWYIMAAMEAEGRATGIPILIGTGGEENESISEVEHMMFNPELYRLLTFENKWADNDSQEVGIDDAPRKRKMVGYFVPGDLFTETTDEEGNSHPEKAREIILKRRNAKKGDKSAWIKEVTQFPLTIEEALMVPDGNRFNAFKLRQQKARIFQYRENEDRLAIGNLEWVRDAQGNIIGADWVDDITGKYRRTEAPVKNPNGLVPEGLYVAGTDSYDKDQAADANRASDGACRIHKLFHTLSDTDDIPVCSLVERPATSEEFFEDTAKLCVYYGWSMNLIEYSNILIGDWYLKNGFGQLLKERPEVAYATTINSKVQNRWGIDPATKHVWEQFAVDWVENNAHKIWDPQLIDKLIRYRSDVNCDESISFFLSIVHAKDVIRLQQDHKPEPWNVPKFTMAGGRLVRSGW